MINIKDNVARLKDEISSVCKRIGRNFDEITLVGVTKFAPIEFIEQAIESGIVHIGENRVQEGQKKYSNLNTPARPVTRHLIGHLQTNKVKDALKVFELIQSVDSLKLAEEIEKQGSKLNRVVDVLIQVNISGEEQKFGADVKDASDLISAASSMLHIRILGLMTIAPLTEDKNIIRSCFSQLRQLKEKVSRDYKNHSSLKMKYLSMGMSGDYEIALEEGANMLRIGRAIFAQEAGAAHV